MRASCRRGREANFGAVGLKTFVCDKNHKKNFPNEGHRRVERPWESEVRGRVT